MAPERETYDVWVLFVPSLTPEGEAFAPALARVFGVDPAIAERIARETPVPVKRAVVLDDAARVAGALESLGAGAEIVSAGTAPRGLLRAPIAASATSATSDTRTWASPPPRPSARLSGRPPAPGASAPPTVKSWTPLPPRPQKSRLVLSPVVLVAGAIALLAVSVTVATKWLRATTAARTAARTLGNTPTQESACASHYGLTGPGLADGQKKKHTLVVAWRTGCLGEDYRAFLQDLAIRHPGDLTIVGAGLATPASRDPRTLVNPPTQPPDPWPPVGCDPGIETLPVERGYVRDVLAPPATYLYDGQGSLVAVWRGGVSEKQRERLARWIDGETWEP